MQRLAATAAELLRRESAQQLLHVCTLTRIDAGSMRFPYAFDHIRLAVSQRARHSTWLRRKLFDSMLNLDRPVWVNDNGFDVQALVNRVTVPAPGGDAELFELCGQLASEPLDRSHPLWELWVIEGLASGEVALFGKTHLAAIDEAGTTLLGELCAPEYDAESAPTDDTEYGQPDLLELAARGALGAAVKPFEVVRIVPWAIEQVPELFGRFTRRKDAQPAVPRTRFNGTITAHRSLAEARIPLADLRAIRDASGNCVTVNDVVLAVVSEALRMYLEDWGALPESSLKVRTLFGCVAPDDKARIVSDVVSLHTDVDDLAARLHLIADETSTIAENNGALAAADLGTAPHELYGLALRDYAENEILSTRVSAHNLAIANVPGVTGQLRAVGARVISTTLFAPIYGGHGLSIQATSTGDQLDIGLLACTELVFDLDQLAECLLQAVAEVRAGVLG